MLLKVESAQPEKQLFIEMTSPITAGNVLPMVEEPRYADFARRLKDAMAEKELTVTDVKNDLNISYEMARRYTLGTAMPRDKKMRRLGDFVGKSAAYLQFGDDSHENPMGNAEVVDTVVGARSAASPPHMEYVDSDNQERGAYYVLEGKASPQSASAKNISPIFGYQITRSGEVEAIHSSVNALADKGLLDAEAIAAITALLHFIESKNNQQ